MRAVRPLLPSYPLYGVRAGEVHPASDLVTASSYRAMLIHEDAVEISVPPQDFHVLVLTRSFRRDMWTDLGGRRRCLSYRPGEAILIPAGCASWWASKEMRSELVHIHLERSAFTDEVIDGLASDPLCPLLPRQDGLLSSTVDALVREAQMGGAGSALFRDAIGIVVARRLTELSHGFSGLRTGALENSSARLAPWQVARVLQRLTDNLAAEPSLGELAAEVGLSPFHFARAFKASTGRPPHRQLVELRLAKACELLDTTDHSITDIAAAVGYDDPGYFARLFRKSVRITPAAYRRERRP